MPITPKQKEKENLRKLKLKTRAIKPKVVKHKH